MPVERREQAIAVEFGSTGNGRNPMFNGRRQPSSGGTSRMTRECQVRICERLGVKLPGPTRQLPGRAVRGSVQRSDARFQGVRQDPDSAARRDRRQQAAVGRVGAGQGAAGRLSGAAAARARCAAAAAEQPRGAGSAVEGAGPTPRCCRGSGLIATAAFNCISLRNEIATRQADWTSRGRGGFF